MITSAPKEKMRILKRKRDKTMKAKKIKNDQEKIENILLDATNSPNSLWRNISCLSAQLSKTKEDYAVYLYLTKLATQIVITGFKNNPEQKNKIIESLDDLCKKGMHYTDLSNITSTQKILHAQVKELEAIKVLIQADCMKYVRQVVQGERIQQAIPKMTNEMISNKE